MPGASLSRAPWLAGLALCACAQTVAPSGDGGAGDDARNDDRPAATGDGVQPGCSVADWRCADLVDPGDRTVWVDQDLDLPDVNRDLWEWNRIRYGVRLGPYRLGRYEVTNEAYLACAATGGCPAPTSIPPSGTPVAIPADYPTATAYARHPALLTWLRAQAVCRFLGGDLPTKAQWQFAADAGGDRRFPWGDVPGCVGNFRFVQTLSPEGDTRLDCPTVPRSPRTLAVDALPAARGPFGSFNLLGNVAELVYNDYAADWSAGLRLRNEAGEFPLDPPPPPQSAGMSVGGSWFGIYPVRYAAHLVRATADAAPTVATGARCVWRAEP